ncbi:hypothetical protein GHR37_22140 [Achromobacter xylosoxidans]|nr:hypothetical protein [Achromobacter xylosoxidans]
MENETYVLEWSQRQSGFHIQPLEHAIKGNRKAFMQNRSCDYIVVHVGSKAECDSAAEMLRPVVMKRAKVAA